MDKCIHGYFRLWKLAKQNLQATSVLPLVFVNKILLEHSQTYLLIYANSAFELLGKGIYCLGPFRLLEQNAINWLVYIQQRLISYSKIDLGGYEVQD